MLTMSTMGFGEIAIFVLLVIVGIVLTAFVFGGWLLVNVLRMVGRGIAGLIGVPHHQRPAFSRATSLRCPRSRCHAENYPTAKFCRRCGMGMNGVAQPATHVKVRRAALY
jgi:hypothetical protein